MEVSSPPVKVDYDAGKVGSDLFSQFMAQIRMNFKTYRPWLGHYCLTLLVQYGIPQYSTVHLRTVRYSMCPPVVPWGVQEFILILLVDSSYHLQDGGPSYLGPWRRTPLLGMAASGGRECWRTPYKAGRQPVPYGTVPADGECCRHTKAWCQAKLLFRYVDQLLSLSRQSAVDQHQQVMRGHDCGGRLDPRLSKMSPWLLPWEPIKYDLADRATLVLRRFHL